MIDRDDLRNELEETSFSADLSDLQIKLKQLTDQESIKDLTSNKASKWDGLICETVHKTFSHLPRKLLLDMSFWQWLSIIKFRDFVYCRWWASKKAAYLERFLAEREKIPKDKALLRNEKTDKVDNFVKRMIGGKSMKSIHTLNSFSRLFWVCEHLYDEKKGYSIAQIAFEKQDIIVSLFERQYSLNSETAKAFVERIKEKHPQLEKKNIQLEAKKLNRYFSTINPDYLSKDDIVKLI